MIDGRSFRGESTKHVGVLTWLMRDCPALFAEIQKINVNEKTITTLFENYHKCNGKPYVTIKEGKPWITLDYGAVLAFAPSWFRFGTFVEQDYHNFSNRLFKSNFTTAFSPGLGMTIDIKLPRILDKTSIYTAAIYHFRNFYSFAEFPNQAGTVIERETYNFDLHELKIPLGVKYTFTERKMTPYVMLGGSFTINLKCNHYFLLETESNGRVVFEKEPALPFKNNQFGFWAGAGIYRYINPVNFLFFEVRSEYTNGLTDLFARDMGLLSSIVGFQFIGGIKF